MGKLWSVFVTCRFDVSDFGKRIPATKPWTMKVASSSFLSSRYTVPSESLSLLNFARS